MNMDSTARDLITAGCHEGHHLGPTLRHACGLESSGLPRDQILAPLEVEFPKQRPVIQPRDEPAPLAEAVECETLAETRNIAAARAKMHELLHGPVIRRGAIMPDACPSGGGRAKIPVGGALRTKSNPIFPTMPDDLDDLMSTQCVYDVQVYRHSHIPLKVMADILESEVPNIPHGVALRLCAESTATHAVTVFVGPPHSAGTIAGKLEYLEFEVRAMQLM